MVKLYYLDRPDTDLFWDASTDWHMYENAERAKGPKAGGTLSGLQEESVEFRIRIAKAKALDKARKNLLTAVHEKEAETFFSSNTSFPSTISRTVDGEEKKTSDIKF